MKPRSWSIVLLLSLFGLNLASASSLLLTGSDPEPFEKDYTGHCQVPTTLTIDPVGKVDWIKVHGDFSTCVGAQMLVMVAKNGNKINFAVETIAAGATELTFAFNSGGATAQFKQKFPDVVSGHLVPAGPLAPPLNTVTPADVTVEISDLWS